MARLDRVYRDPQRRARLRRGGQYSFRLWPIVLALIVVGFTLVRGCGQGPWGRTQVLALTPQQEDQLGLQAYEQVEAQAGGFLPADNPDVQWVRRVGLRLEQAAEDPRFEERIHLKPVDFHWAFNVIESPQINAFCLPGGKVVVYTGILPVCQGNSPRASDSALATVMGHEIAHALAHHGSERIERQRLTQIGMLAAAGSVKNIDLRQRVELYALLGAGAQFGITLPFSRTQESEADHIGLLLMAHAGFDPTEAVRFWQRMFQAAERRGRPPEFLSDHPSTQRRIRDIESWIPDAETYEPSGSRPSGADQGTESYGSGDY